MAVKLVIGNKYGRLTVLAFSHRITYENPKSKPKNCYICRCECGETLTVRGETLTSGHTKSCGCLVSENSSRLHYKHGASHKEKEYSIWKGMKNRCFNKNNPRYKDYGERNIVVCDTWKNDYTQFLRDMGRCPKGLSLERIENDKGYEPSNCKWATNHEQALNRRSARLITYDGITKNITVWADEFGMDRKEFYWKVRHYGFETTVNNIKCKQAVTV